MVSFHPSETRPGGSETASGSPPTPRERSIPELQEHARQRLAGWLMVILGGEVAALMLGAMVPAVTCAAVPIDTIKEL